MDFTWLTGFAILFACVSFSQAGEQDRDHLSVGIMIKPQHCPRESKDGDVLLVRYNNTLIDQTQVLPVRWVKNIFFNVTLFSG